MTQTTLSRGERAPLVTDAIPPRLRRGGAAPRQVLGICLVGALTLALFASRDTPGWAERRGDSWLDHQCRTIAGAWDSAMEQLHLTDPHEALRAAMNRALDWRWSADD
ncbi:MAG TPA: hypothetical protein VG651_25415 [Stellaceae bacterium]|nr:hypothetical protein [Stellaceae bacterium]